MLSEILKSTTLNLLNTILNPIGFYRKKDSFSSNILGHKMFQNSSDEGINYFSMNNMSLDEFKYGEIAIIKTIEKGATVLDLGANIGFFALLYARQVGPFGKVYAFEPGPISYAFLAKNILMNGYTNVDFLNKAVGNVDGKVKFYTCRTGESDNRLHPTPHEERDAIDIEIVNLDNFLGSDTHVDFIKMDIQGSEFLALQGLKHIISNNKNIRILLEYSPLCLRESNVNCEELLEYIQSLNLKKFILWEDKELEEINDEFLLKNCGENKRYPHLNLILKH